MHKLLNMGLLFILFLSSLLLAGCNTVQGAFQGAGQDAKSISHQLQLDDNQSRPATYHYRKKQVSTVTTKSEPVSSVQSESVTTTTTTSSPTTPPPLSPSGD